MGHGIRGGRAGSGRSRWREESEKWICRVKWEKIIFLKNKEIRNYTLHGMPCSVTEVFIKIGQLSQKYMQLHVISLPLCSFFFF